jgi:undecaprenyl pyrophosphate synthase
VELALYIFCNTDVEVFTLWGLSTENLKNRTQAELSYLFELYKRITDDLYEVFRKHHVNFRVA